MVELRIKEVAEVRGIMNAYQLQKATGWQPAMAARVWKGNLRMIALDTIDVLCRALDCEPADLIVRVKDTPKPARSSGNKREAKHK
ncbi:MAG: helix-turn-helix domain-containing protein [Blastocatellia bacterium]